MERSLLQQLTHSELDHCQNELELAIEMHIRWLARINRSLLFHTPAADNDIAERPHDLCNFGRWYRNVINSEVRSLPAYIAIDTVHRELHEIARKLLLQQAGGETINAGDYDRFVFLGNELRERAGELRKLLRHDQGLVSRLMLMVFENASEGVIITDTHNKILSINGAFTRVTGYSAEEAIGKGPALLYSGRQDESFYHKMWLQLMSSGHWEGEIWNRRKNGEVYPEWLSIATITDDDGVITHYVGIFSDITQAKENEQQLHFLAHYDQLTRLPNRILYQDRLRQAMAIAKREHHQVALLFLDLDGFKAVNDTLGHAAGDELLRQVAARLQEGLRESDTASRFGGDEFTVVLPEISSRDGVAHLAAKVAASIARPYQISGTTCHVTASIGISLYPELCSSSDEMIRQADIAMYYAKSHGKNHYEFFDPAWDAPL